MPSPASTYCFVLTAPQLAEERSCHRRCQLPEAARLHLFRGWLMLRDQQCGAGSQVFPAVAWDATRSNHSRCKGWPQPWRPAPNNRRQPSKQSGMRTSKAVADLRRGKPYLARARCRYCMPAIPTTRNRHCCWSNVCAASARSTQHGLCSDTSSIKSRSQPRHRQAAVDRADAGRRRMAAGSMRLPYGGYLAAQFAALTRELFASQDLFEVAERVGDLALECIPGAVASGVTFFEGVRPMAHGATDDVAHQLDAYQLAREEGPICESLDGGEPVSIGDLAGDLRWPSFRSMAAELGIAGVAACGLAVRRDQDWHPLGALTVYAEAPGAFDDDVGDAVSLFAAHLAVVASFDRDRHDVSRREAALHRALGSRDVIGQAKGILMERRHVPAGEAFDILRVASQRLNVRLQELATRLTETGELPD